MTKRRKIACGLIFLIGILCVCWFLIKPHSLNVKTYPVIFVDTGLTSETREIWHRTPEGSEMLPLGFFQCLLDAKTGQPFIEILPRFGFLPDANSPDLLPVGWSSHQDEFLKHPMKNVGINCAACHTGEISYKGKHLRIDGAPNMVDVEAFANDLKASLEKTLKDPVQAFIFLRRFIRSNHDKAESGELLEIQPDTLKFLEDLDPYETSEKEPDSEVAYYIGDAFESAAHDSVEELNHIHERFNEDIIDEGGDTAAIKGHVGGVMSTLHSYRDYLQIRMQFIDRLQEAMNDQTDPGPGRADSFDLIRDLLWHGEHRIPMSAPVSIPDLFSLGEMEYIHWDGNTDSVMQRNLAQAVALGAYYNQETGECHALPHEIHKLETIAKTLHPPKWPEEYLGELDADKVARGKVLFEKSCLSCHSNENKKIPMEVEHATDMTRITNFNKKLGDEPFPAALGKVAGKLQNAVFKAHNIVGAEAEAMINKDAEWLVTTDYYPRNLHGTWATAPFLHNGSVPTLYDLLLPEDQRPTTFPVGHREFDPVKVGYIADPEEVRWTMDTKLLGNSNHGHNYGTTLSEDERMDLIEYLKTL